MFGSDPREVQIDQQIAQMRQKLRLQRKANKQLDLDHARVKGQMMGEGQPAPTDDSINNLRQRLQRLPEYMQPSNVGSIFEAQWDFRFNLTFDFGASPTWGPLTNQTQTFQVDQEACLLLMTVGRSSSAYNSAGELAPLQIQMRDRQSSRVFENFPVPIQFYGSKGNPSILPTPFLLMPNAFFDCTITSINPSNQTTISDSSKHHFSFYGQRMRVQDAEKVLSTIFA